MLARSFTEYAYGGFIKTGRKYHYACSGCGAKASLYSPGRLVLLVTAIPVVAWVILLERYAVWWRALAGIGLAFTLYRLVVDVVTRMRHRPAA